VPGDEADLRRAIERLVDGQHEALGVVRAALERPDTPDEGLLVDLEDILEGSLADARASLGEEEEG
jgi:hypothetical protein